MSVADNPFVEPEHAGSPTPSSPQRGRRVKRWAVEGIYRFGLLLTSLGVLTFGFAGWQLWGTGLQTAAAQDDLSAEFDADFERIGAEQYFPDTTVPDTTDDDAPASSTPDSAVSDSTVPPTDAPPADSGDSLPPRPVDDSGWFRVAQGDAVARIEIPSLSVDFYVVGGVRKEDLQRGPGHHPASVLPGQVGNSVIAAHRTTYGAPFENIDRLVAGDEIIVTLPTGHRYVYVVSTSEVIDPSQADVALAPSQEPVLTLLTCTPKFSAKQRLLVHAELSETMSDQVWEAPTSPVEQYTDVASAGEIEVDEGVEMVTVDVVDLVTGSTVPVEVPAGTSVDEVSVVDGEVIIPLAAPDLTAGFDSGWFSDPTAWGSLWRWGALCAVVSLLAWGLVSRPLERRFDRRRRSQWAANGVGFLIGIAPFGYCLYFFYEAVSRLLPGAV